MITSTSAEFTALKARLKATWMAGDFGQIAQYSEAAAAQFIAQRAIVTGVDIAPNLLEQARARAQRESVYIQFDEDDAEQLPYPEVAFDLVVSKCGTMFAPTNSRTTGRRVAPWTANTWQG